MSLVILVQLLVLVSMGLIVFAVGLKATWSDATSLFRCPRELGRAFLAMNILMPLLAVLIFPWLPLYPAVKIAIVALSVSPVPPFLPGKAIKEGGNQSYVFGLLVSSSLLSIIVVPLTVKLIEAFVHVPFDISASKVALLVGKTILVPLFAGMLISARFPLFSAKIARTVNLLGSLLLVVVLVVMLIASAGRMFSLVGNATILALVSFAAMGLIIGYSLGGPTLQNRRTLSLATASRHPGIAIAIASINFPAQKLVLPAVLLYLILTTILSAVLHRKTGLKQPTGAEQSKAA